MVATSLSMDRLIDDTLKVIATLQGKASKDSTTKGIYSIRNILKGLCHQLNIFLKAYKIKSVLSVHGF
jgi:hypothetical protein